VQLLSHSIAVWRVGLGAGVGLSAETVAAWRLLLSDEELRRADGFHREEHRLDYVTAHAALRVVLGRYLGIAPRAVQFAKSGKAGAKPELAAGPRFNLSHTAGYALIAVSPDLELGIDVEWQRPMDDLEAMARSVMSDEEFATWSTLYVDDRAMAFYHLWTRKEAYLKAIGLGLYRNLQDVTVPVSAARLDPGCELCVVTDKAGSDLWRLRDVPVPEDYSASVCWEGAAAPEITVRDLLRNEAEWLA